METLVLPIAKDMEETPPADFTEDDMDLAAFQLWREASLPDPVAEEEQPA